MITTTGTAIKVLCLERSLAWAPRDASNLTPDAAAAIILRWEGRIRNQTLAVIIVPSMAPRWMYAERPLNTRINPKASTAIIRRENRANTASDLPRGDRTA